MKETSRILQRLYSLDASSPDFSRYLHSLIRYDQRERYLTNLEEHELTRLLDFLDNKVLDVLPTNNDVARECLNKLHAICADHGVLPSSHILSSGLAEMRPYIDRRSGYDYWLGTYHGERVDIINLEDRGQKKKEFADTIFALKIPSHPNIVRPIGVTVDPLQIVVEQESDKYLVVDYLERRPEANRIGLLLDVAEALNFIHANGFLTRIFTGLDVIVDRNGRARVAAAELPSMTRARRINTYAALSAPEVHSGSYSIPAATVFSFGMLVIEAFTGEFPFSQFLTLAAISSKISDGIRPDRPQGAEKLGLTVSLWEMTCRCWHQDPAQRPNITEVAGLLRELSLSPLSMEADLLNFFQVCKTQSRDHRERAQEFANELDEALDSTGLPQEKRDQYLRDLRRLCRAFDLLPPSFLLPQESVKSEAAPFDSGGFSTVFKATFKDGVIAVKVLNVTARVEGEKPHKHLVKVIGWKWLRHENVLPFVGVMSTPSASISIASELMDNGNIMDFIRKSQDCNRVDLLVDAVTGLEYLHENNIVHGALKGANILVDSRCRARLADFGLAMIADESTSRATTAVNEKRDTIRWMAPELLYPEMFEFTGRFKKQLPSKDTDIYATGMTILEVITGCVPFVGVSDNEMVMLKVAKGDRPGKPSSGISDALWDLLVATWVAQYARRPRERPSLSTVLTRLKGCIDDRGKSITPPMPEDSERSTTPPVLEDLERSTTPPIPEDLEKSATPPILENLEDIDAGDPTTTASNSQHRISYPTVSKRSGWSLGKSCSFPTPIQPPG